MFPNFKSLQLTINHDGVQAITKPLFNDSDASFNSLKSENELYRKEHQKLEGFTIVSSGIDFENWVFKVVTACEQMSKQQYLAFSKA